MQTLRDELIVTIASKATCDKRAPYSGSTGSESRPARRGIVRGAIERLISLITAASIVVVPTGTGAQVAGTVPLALSIKSCNVVTSYTPVNPFYGPAQQTPVGSVRLAFVNDNDSSAISVRFILTEGRYTQSVVFNGTFARGITIERAFQEDPNAGGNENITCAVADVHFVDGSSWSATNGRAGRP